MGGSAVVALLLGVIFLATTPNAGDAGALSCLLGIGLLGIAVVIHFMSRIRVVVDSAKPELRLERGKSALQRFSFPLEYEFAWYWDAVADQRGRARSYPVLRVHSPKLALHENLGALHSPPKGWPEKVLETGSTPVCASGIGRVQLQRLVSALAVSSANRR